MLTQATKVYTKKIFKDFQDQFQDVDLFIVSPVVDGVTFYEVKKYDQIKKQ